MSTQHAPTRPLGVSIVICCYNSAARIVPTLEHLKAQRVSGEIPWEVIMMDASNDNTAEVARQVWGDFQAAPLRVLLQPLSAGLANAHQRGMEEARFEVISNIDDDNWVAPDWIETASHIMSQEPRLGAVGSINEPAFAAPPPPWFETYAEYFAILTDRDYQRLPGPITGIIGAGLTVRKAAWQKLLREGYQSMVLGGGSNNAYHLSAGEDSELTAALHLAGWKLSIEPRLRLQHWMPAWRMDWMNLRRVVRRYSSVAIMDAYNLERYTSEPGIANRLRLHWWWHLRAPLRELARRPLAVLRAACFACENSAEAIAVERAVGRIIGLVRTGDNYRKARLKVHAARWKHPEALPAGG